MLILLVTIQQQPGPFLGIALVTGILRRTLIPLQVALKLLCAMLVHSTEGALHDETPG